MLFYRTLVQSTRSLLMKYWDLDSLEWFMEVCVMTLTEIKDVSFLNICHVR